MKGRYLVKLRFLAVHKLIFRNKFLNYFSFDISGNIRLMYAKSLFSQAICLMGLFLPEF